MRIGAFYPPMSLENRARGWQTPYSITPSAISSWIGEEIRTIGVEGQIDWLGTRTGHDFDLGLTAALYGWNDPAGVMIASHGFALQDRQTTLFGRVGERNSTVMPAHELFHEIDRRAGFYVGAQAHYLDRAVLNLLHYDNRADPHAYSAAIQDFAWETKFDAAALRIETAGGWTLIAQRLQGETSIAPPGLWLEWKFNSSSALLAKSHGPHLLSVRYDDFDVELDSESYPGGENGSAWTLAYSFDRDDNWRFTLEWLRVRSDVGARPLLLGEPELATETKVELAVRYSIAGTLPRHSAAPRPAMARRPGL